MHARRPHIGCQATVLRSAAAAVTASARSPSIPPAYSSFGPRSSQSARLAHAAVCARAVYSVTTRRGARAISAADTRSRSASRWSPREDAHRHFSSSAMALRRRALDSRRSRLWVRTDPTIEPTPAPPRTERTCDTSTAMVEACHRQLNFVTASRSPPVCQFAPAARAPERSSPPDSASWHVPRRTSLRRVEHVLPGAVACPGRTHRRPRAALGRPNARLVLLHAARIEDALIRSVHGPPR